MKAESSGLDNGNYGVVKESPPCAKWVSINVTLSELIMPDRFFEERLQSILKQIKNRKF